MAQELDQTTDNSTAEDGDEAEFEEFLDWRSKTAWK